MNKQKLLLQIHNNHKNVRFGDFVLLIQSFGFKLLRISGSHHIFEHKNINEIINIQNVNGKAKPYQIKQFMALIEKYCLTLEA